tara:strand:- start:952 stop:3228 length:2277 start_codon:yes stop_codon:yes gene_type:complete
MPGVFEIWNNQAVDQLFVFRSSSETLRPAYNNKVIHVDINNVSIQKLERHYLDRSFFAKLIDNLDSMQVSAQIYDFIFAARLDEANDRQLIEATRKANNVYYGLAFELLNKEQVQKIKPNFQKVIPYLDQSKWSLQIGDNSSLYAANKPLITFSDLAYASRGLGSLSIKFDNDGVLRRVPLIVLFGDAYYPILPFRVICDYLGVPTHKLLIKPGESITLQDAQYPGEDKYQDIIIPIDKQGNMIVNYIGPWGQMDHYNFVDILQASNNRVELDMWRRELKGKIVLISDISTGSTDVGPVPTDANFPLSGVHTSIINQILTKSFLKALSDWEMLIIEILLMVSILILSLWLSSVYFSIGTLVLGIAYFGIVCISFFYWGLIFQIVRPLFMMTLALVSIAIYHYVYEEREKTEGLRQRDFIRQTFGRYLSHEVVEKLLTTPDGLELGGENREVTFLVSDLRGFTALSMQLTPQEVIRIINRYLSRMIEIINQHKGTLNEIEGDGLLVFFGAPLMSKEAHIQAVACAIDMQNAMLELNKEQQKNGLPELSMGIGLNTGNVIVGNIGSKDRAKYCAIGSPINTAYRIESHTIGGQILISPSTYVKVAPIVQISDTLEAQFKGMAQPMSLHDVTGLKGKFNVELLKKEAHEFIKISPPILIACSPMEGKLVSNDIVSGQLTHIKDSTVAISVERSFELRSNLRIIIVTDEVSELPEMYTKVIFVASPEPHSLMTRLHLEFTWLPEDTKKYIHSFSDSQIKMTG